MMTDDEKIASVLAEVEDRRRRLAREVVASFRPVERLSVAEVLAAADKAGCMVDVTTSLRRVVGCQEGDFVPRMTRICDKLELSLPTRTFS